MRLWWAISWVIVGQLLAIAALAQNAAPDLAALTAKYPGSRAVYLVRKRTIELRWTGQEVKVLARNYSVVAHLLPFSDAYSNNVVGFSKFNPIAWLRAHTRLSTGDTLPVKNIVTRNAINAEFFYDDYQEKTFHFPAVAPGVCTVLEYEEELTEPRFLGLFYFGAVIPVVEAELEIIADEEIGLQFAAFHLATLGRSLDADEKTQAGRRHYRWRATNLAPHLHEPQAPDLAYRAAHVAPYIAKLPPTATNAPVLANVADLHRWYASLSAPVLAQPLSPELQALVDSLAAPRPNLAAKASAIFTWVQQHVQYLAFEDGYGGLVPRPASLTFKRRYGDCKDMTWLLVAMLRRAGLEAYPAWVGTRKLPYTYAEMPTPLVDNHAVAVVKLLGHSVVLDATNPYLPFGLPSAMTQGKQALVSLGPDRYEIFSIPEMEARRNLWADSTVIDWQPDGTVINTVVQLSDYTKVKTEIALAGQDTAQLLPQVFGQRHWLGKTAVEAWASWPEQARLKARFTTQHYVQAVDDELFANLHFCRRVPLDRVPAERRSSRQADYRFCERSVCTLVVPPGYQPLALPPDVKIQNEAFSLLVQYRQTDGAITLTKEFLLNTLTIAPDHFNAWNGLITELAQAYRQTVVLKKINPKP
jgi:transglutaminase-like putative cysteine protease